MGVGWHYHAYGVIGLEINFQMCTIYEYLYQPDIEEVFIMVFIMGLFHSFV